MSWKAGTGTETWHALADRGENHHARTRHAMTHPRCSRRVEFDVAESERHTLEDVLDRSSSACAHARHTLQAVDNRVFLVLILSLPAVIGVSVPARQLPTRSFQRVPRGAGVSDGAKNHNGKKAAAHALWRDFQTPAALAQYARPTSLAGQRPFPWLRARNSGCLTRERSSRQYGRHASGSRMTPGPRWCGPQQKPGTVSDSRQSSQPREEVRG